MVKLGSYQADLSLCWELKGFYPFSYVLAQDFIHLAMYWLTSYSWKHILLGKGVSGSKTRYFTIDCYLIHVCAAVC